MVGLGMIKCGVCGDSRQQLINLLLAFHLTTATVALSDKRGGKMRLSNHESEDDYTKKGQVSRRWRVISVYLVFINIGSSIQ